MTFWMVYQSIDLFSTRGTWVGYLDPGTGSYALQLLLAGAFGGLFVLKQSWRQCRSWLAQVRLVRR